MPLIVQREERRRLIAARAPQRLGEDVQALDYLIRRLQPGMAQDVGNAERAQAMHGDTGRLPAQLEEHADHGQHALHQRQHVARLLDVAADQRRCSGGCRRRLDAERANDLLLEPAAHLGWCGLDLVSRQSDTGHDHLPELSSLHGRSVAAPH
jgi:hypothetical protein